MPEYKSNPDLKFIRDNIQGNLYIDGQFVSETNSIHQQSLILEPGQHVLTVMDGNANSKSVAFQILGR